MTTTNETTKPEVPAWMNLDQYCSPEIRERLNEAAALIEDLLEPTSGFMVACRAAYEVACAHERATSGLANEVDDAHLLFDPYTGWDRFSRAAGRLEAAAACATGDTALGYRTEDIPEWYVEWGSRYGLREAPVTDA